MNEKNKKKIEATAEALSLASNLLSYPEKEHLSDYNALVSIVNEVMNDDFQHSENLHLSDLEAEYIRLFVTDIGGVKAPPYASFYLEKRLMGRSSEKFLNFIKHCGYEIDENIIKGPPDHVSLEIGFLSRLLEENNFECVCVMIEKHLLWFDEFREKVKENSNFDFYRKLVELVSTLIKYTKEAVC